jgi:signal transduction histidine kinase
MQNGRWRLSNELVLWHSIALAVTCLGVGALSYYLLLRPLERELPNQAKRFAEVFAEEISTDLWNLDTDGIWEQLRKQYLNPSLLGIRVENQFGDGLAEWVSEDERGTSDITVIQPIFRNDELIGNVHVSWSRKPLQVLRDGLWPALLGISAIGIAVQFILTWFLTQRFLRRPLHAIVQRMRNTARGDYDLRIQKGHHEEIYLLNREVSLMARKIRDNTEALKAEIAERQLIEAELVLHRQKLEELVLQRTTQLDQANRSLRQEMAQRKLAQSTIIKVSTHEQQRIGQDLHDTLGQEIVGARYLLASLERGMETVAPQYHERLRQLAAMLHDIMEHARMLAHGLMVVNLNDGGLAVALEAHAQKTAQLFSIKCRFRLNGPPHPDLDESTSVQLYFIAQEAVNNAIRHGNASRIRIMLGWRRGTACLQISDNGRGFINEDGTGTGLIIMRSRAESIGGSLTIWSRPGLGSCIRCSF